MFEILSVNVYCISNINNLFVFARFAKIKSTFLMRWEFANVSQLFLGHNFQETVAPKMAHISNSNISVWINTFFLNSEHLWPYMSVVWHCNAFLHKLQRIFIFGIQAVQNVFVIFEILYEYVFGSWIF